MKSTPEINCPHCKQIIDLWDSQNYSDDLFREETTYIDCIHCDKQMEITPNAIWSYKVRKPEE